MSVLLPLQIYRVITYNLNLEYKVLISIQRDQQANQEFRGNKMAWWLQLIIIWLSVDIVVMATGWYGVTTIKPKFPHWWKRVIADVEPDCADEVETVKTYESPVLATEVPQ